MKLPNLIVADECVEYEIVGLLRQNEIPVLSIMESHQGIQDIEVLQITTTKNAFLYRLKLPHTGILLVRFPNGYDPDLKAAIVVKTIIEKFDEIDNYFSVLNENKLRVKR
jgi:hypothetical protein